MTVHNMMICIPEQFVVLVVRQLFIYCWLMLYSVSSYTSNVAVFWLLAYCMV